MADEKDLTALLVSLGWLDEDIAETVRREIAETGAPPIQVLRRQGLVTDEHILEALRGHLDLPEVDPGEEHTVDLDLLRWISRDLAEAHLVLPLEVWREGDAPVLRLAMADPLHGASVQAVEKAAGVPVEPVLADPGRLERSITASYDRITTRLIPRPDRHLPGDRGASGHRRRWRTSSADEPQTEPSHRLEDEATPLQQVEALRLVLEEKGLVTREEFVAVLKTLLRRGGDR